MRWVDQLLSKVSHIQKVYFIGFRSKQGWELFNTSQQKGQESSQVIITSSHSSLYNWILVIICQSADVNAITPLLHTIITSLLHTIITSGNSDPKLNKLPGPTVSPKPTVPSLYIQAWLTMGKIFIVDGKLANNFITLFVQVWSLTWHYSITTVLKNYFLENTLKRYPRDNSSGYVRKTYSYVTFLKQSCSPKAILFVMGSLCIW